MIIKVNKFSDLGKCSMGSLIDSFDTDKDHIYVQVKEFELGNNPMDCYAEVKINNACDLCKWLWNVAGISNSSPEGHKWYFHKCEDWWISEFSQRIEQDDLIFEKYKKKLDSETDPKKIQKIQNKMIAYNTTILKKMIGYYKRQKSTYTKKIISSNV